MGIFDFLKKKETEPKISVTISPVSSAEIISVETRMKYQQPTCDSLYPHEVLILSYAEGCTTTQNEFARFWWYRYGIKDVGLILKKLYQMQFIKIGTIESTLAQHKLPELKQLLKNSGLKVSGKKSDIVQRILDNISVQEITKQFPEKYYELTELGEKTLSKFEWIPYIHRHDIDGLDIWNLTQLVQTPPYTKFRDKIWAHCNSQSGKYAKQGDWGLYRNMRFQMSEFVLEENKPEVAFSLLCEVVSYDLSGVGNGFRPEFIANDYQLLYPYEKSIVKMSPVITARIKTLSDLFGWNEAKLYSELKTNFDKYSVQFSVFSSEEKAQIVISSINEDENSLKKVYSISEKRFRKQYHIH